VTSRLGTGKSITFLQCSAHQHGTRNKTIFLCYCRNRPPHTCSFPPPADIIAASLSFLLIFLLSASKERGEFFSAYFIHRGPRTGAHTFSTQSGITFISYIIVIHCPSLIYTTTLTVRPPKNLSYTQLIQLLFWIPSFNILHAYILYCIRRINFSLAIQITCFNFDKTSIST
jgi:hypothetical protein